MMRKVFFLLLFFMTFAKVCFAGLAEEIQKIADEYKTQVQEGRKQSQQIMTSNPI